MTKPAAFVLQLIGVLVILAAIGSQSWIVGILGGLLVIAGGIGVRRRMRDK